MKLSEFIAEHREPILEAWVEFARTCAPGAEAMDMSALRDHASEMLDAIILDLNTPQTRLQQADKSLGKSDAPGTRLGAAGTAAQSHGAARARSGFNVEQMVSEYRALRASVLRLWLDAGHELHADESEDLMRFNEAIDQALAESTGSYARVVEGTLREAQEQLERRVVERTRELAEANGAMRVEMQERRRLEELRIGLLQQLVQAQENEQRRISRELHDQLGQQVTALSLKLSALKSWTEVPPHVQNELAALGGIVSQLDKDIETIVWQLRPTALDDLGLVVALDDYVANWARHFGISARFRASGVDGVRLSSEIEIVLYRVTQEALNNVAKHARAKHVEITLRRDPQETFLTISDDGIGFELHERSSNGRHGVGLNSMRERAGLVGGTTNIEATPGRGTTVMVRVPAVPSTYRRLEG